MKYELVVMNKWNRDTNNFDVKWDFVVEGDSLFPDEPECEIKWVRGNIDGSIKISLSTIPARIDLDSIGSIWIHGWNGIKLFPEPYKSLKEWTSKVIWTNPDLQLAELVK